MSEVCLALLGSGSRGRKSSEGRGAGPSKLLSGARELPAGLTSSCSRETDLLTLEILDPSDLASKYGHDDRAAVKAGPGSCQQAWQAPAAKVRGFLGHAVGTLHGSCSKPISCTGVTRSIMRQAFLIQVS